MNVDLKYRSFVIYNGSKEDDDGRRLLSAECEVFIWREGNQYAVSLNMREEMKLEDFHPEVEYEFLKRVFERAKDINEKWKLVNMKDGEGKVIGQKQITFYK
jgi:hypothetical protein